MIIVCSPSFPFGGRADCASLACAFRTLCLAGRLGRDEDCGAVHRYLKIAKCEPAASDAEIAKTVGAILAAVEERGEDAVREFSRRFGIPARTLEGWEQGRRQPDPAASVLLRVIEHNPGAVRRGAVDVKGKAGA